MNQDNAKLKATVTELLDILNTKEESPNGGSFHPVKISSCRVGLSDRLQEVLNELELGVDYHKNS